MNRATRTPLISTLLALPATAMVVFALSVSGASVAFADGCLPGEPCYDAGPPAAPVATPAPVSPPVAPAMTKPADDSYFVEQPFYTTIGAGWSFLEKDEEILGYQTYEVRLGAYRYWDRVSVEALVAILPDVRAREWPDPGRFRLEDDTDGIRLGGDFLFHIMDEADTESVDPYIAFGGGANIYDDALKDGHSDWIVGTGAGAFLNLSERWFVKPDYRAAVVGDNTEINHFAMLALGFRWGCDPDAG